MSNFDFQVSNSREALETYISSYTEFLRKLEELPKKERPVSEDKLWKYFLEVHNMELSRTHFRRNTRSSDSLVCLWMQRIKSQVTYKLMTEDIPKYDGLTKHDLMELARYIPKPESIKEVQEYLRAHGIIFEINRTIKRTNLDGAVFMLPSGNPVVAMTLRYTRLDYFWFTLLHELAHLVLHNTNLDASLYEISIQDDIDDTDIQEIQANRLASEILIPRRLWRTFYVQYDLSEDAIKSFAEKNNTHPIIVAGRICKEKNRYGLYRSIIDGVNTEEILYG